jgi:hypothetical protein
LDLPYEVAAALTELASTSGLSVEEYLRRIVEQRLAERPLVETDAQDVSGMVLETGCSSMALAPRCPMPLSTALFTGLAKSVPNILPATCLDAIL